jgi:hypothetical protein
VRTPVIVRWIAVVLAFAVPALSGCATSRGPADIQRTTSSQLTGIVGFRWRIAEVQHGAASVTVPRTRGGYFAFTPEGDLAADDTVNHYAGRFTSTANGYHVTIMRVSLAGYVGHDPVTLALIAGTQALTGAGAHVTVGLTGTRLDLSAGRTARGAQPGHLSWCVLLPPPGQRRAPAPAPRRWPARPRIGHLPPRVFLLSAPSNDRWQGVPLSSSRRGRESAAVRGWRGS